MKEFRPISLGNVIYKLVMKTLANRLKQVLLFVIASSQSAFVSGRLINDNVMATFEFTHSMRRRTSGDNAFISLKLDMT